MPRIPKETQKRISPEFQKRISDLVEETELNQKEFAKAVEISNATLSRATFYGIIPSLQTLLKLADYFNCSLSYLLGETNENHYYKSDNPKSFQQVLNTLMKEKHTSYGEIANTMPFSANFFYEWKRVGTLPSLEYLQAIAEHFQVTPDYLLGRTDDRN